MKVRQGGAPFVAQDLGNQAQTEVNPREDGGDSQLLRQLGCLSEEGLLGTYVELRHHLDVHHPPDVPVVGDHAHPLPDRRQPPSPGAAPTSLFGRPQVVVDRRKVAGAEGSLPQGVLRGTLSSARDGLAATSAGAHVQARRWPGPPVRLGIHGIHRINVLGAGGVQRRPILPPSPPPGRPPPAAAPGSGPTGGAAG